MAALLRLWVAASGPFRGERLLVDGDVVTVVAADLDGDGKTALLATYTTGLPPYQKRFLAIFWNRNGVFAPRPDLSLPVSEEEACAFDVGPVGGGSDELLVLTPRGVLAQSFRGRAAGPQRKIVDQPTLFHQPIPGELPRVRLLPHPGPPGDLLPALGALPI